MRMTQEVEKSAQMLDLYHTGCMILFVFFDPYTGGRHVRNSKKTTAHIRASM